MPKIKVKAEQLVLGLYLTGAGAMLLIRKSLVFPRDWLELIGLFIGGATGWLLVWFDKIAFVYIIHPEAQISQYVKYQIEKRNYKGAFELMEARAGEMEKLTSRSVLFQAAYIVLALFALTSTASMFGKSLVMGLGLRIILTDWQEYLKDKEGLKRKLFWQIQRQVSNLELKWYMYLGTGVFAWLTWLWV